MSRPRLFRLLPAVMLVGAGVLALNATGLVHQAYAQVSAPAPDTGVTAPANQDYADAGVQVASAATVDVTGAFARRRIELDAREAQINTQQNVLAAAEARVDAKIAQLKSLQDSITQLLAQRDGAQQAQINSLVKTYSAMKPADAARIFNSLQDDVLVPVAQLMKSDVLAAILGKMQPDAAQKLTVKLADKLVLPTDAAAAIPGALVPVAQAAATPPGPTASAAPSAAPAPAKPSGG